MRKQEFLARLRRCLAGLPQGDIEERVSFYSEMIDDRMEEGCSEEDAIRQIGSVDEVAARIVADVLPEERAEETTAPQRRLKAWEIVLLALGSPVWLSLLIAAFAVVLSLYISLWAVIVSLWSAFGALIGCALGGVVAGIGFVCGGQSPAGIAMIGAGIACGGLSILLFYGCKSVTKGILLLTKKSVQGMGNRFGKKEVAR